MPNQRSTTNNSENPNTRPDKHQVAPENIKQVEKEGQQFETQNKNPETYKNEPEVKDPAVKGQPDNMEVAGDEAVNAQDAYEGTDEPNPYHELQGSDDRGVGQDKAEGRRDNIH